MSATPQVCGTICAVSHLTPSARKAKCISRHQCMDAMHSEDGCTMDGDGDSRSHELLLMHGRGAPCRECWSRIAGLVMDGGSKSTRTWTTLQPDAVSEPQSCVGPPIRRSLVRGGCASVRGRNSEHIRASRPRRRPFSQWAKPIRTASISVLPVSCPVQALLATGD